MRVSAGTCTDDLPAGAEKVFKKSTGPTTHRLSGRDSRGLSPQSRLGLDGPTGPTQPAQNGFEYCYANSDHTIGAVGVVAFHIDRTGRPTEAVTIGKEKMRVVCCISAPCIAATRAKLLTRGIKTYLGNPINVGQLIATRDSQQTAPSPISANTTGTNAPTSLPRATN